jgi:hypothetical protein
VIDSIRSHTGDEQGFPGEGPWLEVFYNNDWYVRVTSLDTAMDAVTGQPLGPMRRVSPPVRFRCSGAQNDVATMLVAALHASIAPEAAPETESVISRCVSAISLALLRTRATMASFFYIDRTLRRGAERIMDFLTSEDDYERTAPLVYSGTHRGRRIHIIIEPAQQENG